MRLPSDRIENVEQSLQSRHRGPHALRIVEGQLEKATRQPKPAPREDSSKLGALAEVSDGAEVDARIAAMIASGYASRSDRFVVFRSKSSDDEAPGVDGAAL